MTAQQYSSRRDRTPKRGSGLPPGQGSPSSQSGLIKGRPLSRQLLQTLLPVTLLPLAVASGLGIVVTSRTEHKNATLELQERSYLASGAASFFVEESFEAAGNVLINPAVIETLREAGEKAIEDGLVDRPAEALNQQFSQTKLIEPNATINQYLADVAELEELAQILLTEPSGLNAAYSSPSIDFVQNDEEWWSQAQQVGQYIEPAGFDEATGELSTAFAAPIRDPESQELVGTIRVRTPVEELNEQISAFLINSLAETQQVQIIDTRNGVAFSTVTTDEAITDDTAVIGGDTIVQVARVLTSQVGQPENDLEALQQELEAQFPGINVEELIRIEVGEDEDEDEDEEAEETEEAESSREILDVVLQYAGKDYSIATVPDTPWVAIASADTVELDAAGRNLLIIFVLSGLILGAAAAGLLVVLARNLSQPLQTLTETARKAAAGQLDTRANPQGTIETQVLGQGFNNLLEQLQSLLGQQKAIADEQQKQKENLENEISQLMEEVGDAANGDLSVRAKLSAGDVGIIADLFNAIIENLRDIAVNVKQSTGEVSQSLLTNEQEIRTLAEQAVEEARSMQVTMTAVEEMGQSIQTVANNANQASALTNDTYETVQAGTQSMEQTAESIVELRSTVGETAKKIKRLGESAQKIAQAVSLIDEIALKTNLLAVNASVEAARAGELGQGFSAVAEQVGALADQSAGATKTIAQIVAEIQTETQEVVTAIETGTAQVVDSSNLVKTTQQQLEQVLAKSEQINQLMQGISDSTVGQTRASAAVTELIQKATQESEQRSQTSAQMAQAIQETAKVAQALQASVEQFKVIEA
ncbi:MAG: methyl-accepting chemotaxis protein [Cyanobacteria bacterium P01_A01_bin.114]